MTTRIKTRCMVRAPATWHRPPRHRENWASEVLEQNTKVSLVMVLVVMVVPGSSWLWLWYGYGSSWMFLVVRPISISGGGTLPAQPNTAFLLSRKSSFVGAQAGLSMFHFFIHNSFVSLLTTSEHIEPKVFIFHNISDANEFYRYAHKASTQDKCGR